MSSQPTSSSPYVSVTAARTAKRPGWLTAVCVIAIVWGSIKVLLVLWGIIGAAFQSQIQELFLPLQGMGQTAPQKEAMQEYMTELNDMMARWSPVTYTSYALDLLVAGGLLTGAIMTLNWTPAGWKLLASVMWGAAALQLVGTVPTVIMQLQTGKIVDRYMSRMLQAQPGARAMPPGMQRMMSTMMGAGVAVGMCMSVGWMTVVAGLYVAGAIYLRRPTIQALFVQPQAVRAPP